MGRDRAALLAVLEETRAYLARPDNDFSWSSFGDADTALEELDRVTATVRGGGPIPLVLTGLFAPTGPIQEVSLSSGWGDEFLALAERFDAEVNLPRPGRASSPS